MNFPKAPAGLYKSFAAQVTVELHKLKRMSDNEALAELEEFLQMDLIIGESDRQAIILALARLSRERPGWDFMLNEIACKMDNVAEGRAEMYDRFRKLDFQANPPTIWERLNTDLQPSRTP
jgi:hypothetical protein